MVANKNQLEHPWPRESSTATDRLDTKLGSPEIKALSVNHVSVSGGIPHNVDESTETALTINGVSYSVQGHFHRWADGEWHAGSDHDKWNAERGYDYREPHLSRREYDARKSYAQNEPSQAAAKKARVVLTEAVAAWASANEDKLAQADQRKRQEDAHLLATQLDRCEQATRVVRKNLCRCLAGHAYSVYPLKTQPELDS